MPEHTPAEAAKNVADPGRPARLRRQGVNIPNRGPVGPTARRPLPAQAAPRAAEARAAAPPNRGGGLQRRNAAATTPQARRDALRRRLR